ncbi:hypothetical protein F4818DRAFT_453432 [Hypoxylon cercidicola]|nr:hypothetical protein F4818DRAFT_453432 [Hypoxylon cercidicola]
MGYSKEVIDYILERMIPNHPLPRGGIKKRCDEVAVMVNEDFTPDELCGKEVEPKNILYVYQKYGTDPAYGARKGQVIYPAKKSAERSTPRLLPSNAKQVDCPHCGGTIYLEGSQPSAAMSTPSSVPKSDPTTVPTTAPTTASTTIPATIPTTWSSMPNDFYDTQAFNPIPQLQPQAQTQPQSQSFPAAGTMPLWCDPNAYSRVPQNTAGQSGQSQGTWGSNAAVNNMMDPQLQGGWLSNSATSGGNQQTFSTNLFEGQNMGGVNAGTQPRHKQPASEAIPNSHQPSVSPMGLGIRSSQPTQPVHNWPTSQNVITSAPRASVPKRPRSRSQPASPTPKRSKTATGSSVLENNIGYTLTPSGPLPGTTADDSLSSTFDGHPALSDIQFDWSYPNPNDSQQQHVPEAAPAANPSNGYEDLDNLLPDLDGDFYAKFLAELGNLPAT